MKNPTNLGGRVGSVSNFPKRGEVTMSSLVKLDCNVQKMSSREIAELCNKRHDNVMADIKKMLSELSLAAPEFSGTAFVDGPNNSKREIQVFNLLKRETLILVSGYNIELRARIIDRWAELESQAQHQPLDPMQTLSDPNALRGLLLGYSEKVITLEAKVDEMQPDVDAFDRIAKADGSLCLTDTAKALQMRPKDFISLLNQKQWIYKRTGSAHYVGYQDKVQSGYLEHKVTEVSRSDGSSKITEQVRVTPKGLTKLSRLLGNQQ